jgi:foldase protein PrsA
VASGCGGGGVPGNAVAVVDGEAIERKMFDHWLAVAARSGGKPNTAIPKPPDYTACVAQKRKSEPKTSPERLKVECRQEYEGLRNQVVQLLVSRQWLEEEAAERGIRVSEAEVKRSFDQQRKAAFRKDGEFQKFLKNSGQTQEDILLRVRLDLLSNKIRQKVTAGKDKVTDKQIADYYAKNKARFAQPERRDVNIVLTKTKAKAEEAKAAVASGSSWKAVAKEHSIDRATKSEGGKLMGVVEGQQEKALDEALFKARKGKLTGPVKTPFGYYLFEVVRVTKASQQTLAQAKPVIKQQIIAERQQKALDAFTKSFQAKWRERTECHEGFLTPDCSNGPKPAASPAAAAGQAQAPRPPATQTTR